MSIEKKSIPQASENLIRNLDRRKGLLARISQTETSDIPDIVIKDTFLKFLDKQYKGLEKPDIADLNERIFMLINRAASLAASKQDTAVVTSMYAYPYKDARPIDETSYNEFKKEVKSIIALCKHHGISIKSITGMQNGLGVPKVETLNDLLTWCTDKNVDLKSITGMQNGLGVPKVETIEEQEELLGRYRKHKATIHHASTD